ncbi:ribosomal subunit interface protein [Rhodothermaceae bacterium RA]|nr:ribosomal subunit interface protein [Rhodothermaceae bacterium RA]
MKRCTTAFPCESRRGVLPFNALNSYPVYRTPAASPVPREYQLPGRLPGRPSSTLPSSNRTHDMEAPALNIEYHSDTHEFTEAMKEKVEHRIRKLMRGHKDITGASVAVERHVTPQQHNKEYRVRIVLYFRPDNIAAVSKSDSLNAALQDALEAAERQVREHRDKLRERWKRA